MDIEIEVFKNEVDLKVNSHFYKKAQEIILKDYLDIKEIVFKINFKIDLQLFKNVRKVQNFVGDAKVKVI